MTRGRFITFEGIDGAGKSSHIGRYVERLRSFGVEVVQSREPGGSPLAEQLRECLLNRPMSATAELLIAFAARDDHLERTIRPALAAGRWVVCDRFTDSTVAYQGGGRGVPLERIVQLERWVHPDLQPDRTYLFDLEPAAAAQRRTAARDADRFEREDAAFFARVRDAYRRRSREDPERFLEIDSAKSPGEVQRLLQEDLLSLWQKWSIRG